MKKIIAIALLACSLSNVYASSLFTTSMILDGVTQLVLSPFVSTIGTIAQRRGVAFTEQIKDDLIELNDDMVAGRVSAIADVRQPALKELLEEISRDQSQMDIINSAVTSGSQLHRVATAVTIALLSE